MLSDASDAHRADGDADRICANPRRNNPGNLVNPGILIDKKFGIVIAQVYAGQFNIRKAVKAWMQ